VPDSGYVQRWICLLMDEQVPVRLVHGIRAPGSGYDETGRAGPWWPCADIAKVDAVDRQACSLG